MFTGFTQETVDFMWGLRFNNEKSWFEAHREEFQRSLNEPMKALCDDIFAALDGEYPELGLRHKVSRIYRDARRLLMKSREVKERLSDDDSVPVRLTLDSGDEVDLVVTREVFVEAVSRAISSSFSTPFLSRTVPASGSSMSTTFFSREVISSLSISSPSEPSSFRQCCSPGWTRTINRPINSRELCQLSYRGPLSAVRSGGPEQTLPIR